MLFLFTYVIKTILLFTNKGMLVKYSSATKVPEMIISVVFLVTGIWLFMILGGIKTMHIIKLILVFVSIPVAIIGFKKFKKGLALLSLLLIVGAYGLAKMSKAKPFIPANAEIKSTTNQLLSEGALVYHQNCVFCHGSDGSKMYRNATDLSKSMLNDDAIIVFVQDGSKGKMPAYRIILSDENIASVTAFVKSLRNTDPGLAAE
jgi:mono/diheme cytochrome c family protein